MELLWSVLEKSKASDSDRKHLFLFFNSICFGILGFIIWLIVSRFTMETVGWMICFIGYPGYFIGFIGGFIYLCRK